MAPYRYLLPIKTFPSIIPLHVYIFSCIIFSMLYRSIGLVRDNKFFANTQKTYKLLDTRILNRTLFTASRLHGFTASRLHGFTASRRQFSLDNFLFTFYTHNYFFSSLDTDRHGLRPFVHSSHRPEAFLCSLYVFLSFISIFCFFFLTSKNFLILTLYVIPPVVEYGINRRLNLPGNEVIKHIYCMDYDLIY